MKHKEKLIKSVWIKEQTYIDRNVLLVSTDMKYTNYFAFFFHSNYTPTRLNVLGQYTDTVVYVGQLQAGLGSVRRLQVIDWTPFVNQLDPFLQSDTELSEKQLRHASLLDAGGKPFQQRPRDISK